MSSSEGFPHALAWHSGHVYLSFEGGLVAGNAPELAVSVAVKLFRRLKGVTASNTETLPAP